MFFILFWKSYVLVNGCNAGGSLTCVNSAICLTNGTCQCTYGFTGTTCQTCNTNLAYKQ